MDEHKLYILLNLIERNGDVKQLIREGMSYEEIAVFTKIAIGKGYVSYKEDDVLISEDGHIKLQILAKKFKKTDKKKWIDKEEQSKIPKLEKDFIFLPNQDNLQF